MDEVASAGRPTKRIKIASLDDKANGHLIDNVEDDIVQAEIRADFLVNEILSNGEVLHLRSLEVPLKPKATASAPSGGSDAQAVGNHQVKLGSQVIGKSNNQHQSLDQIKELIGVAAYDQLRMLQQDLHNDPKTDVNAHCPLVTNSITDKISRKRVHEAVRDFLGRSFETTTLDNDAIRITHLTPRALIQSARRFEPALDKREAEKQYLHFTLYKENTDTMDAINQLALYTKRPSKTFQFSGTKDRRAITVQRCSAHRLSAERLQSINKRQSSNIRIGDFRHENGGLELGDLNGNEFVITLRNCHFPGVGQLATALPAAKEILKESIGKWKTQGFLNYYGLQRFGSFVTSTDVVGTRLLQQDFKGAVSAILDFDVSLIGDGDLKHFASRDTILRAKAIDLWQRSHDSAEALKGLPRRFLAESNIIRHLGSRNKNTNELNSLTDYQGALGGIPRNLKLMYVHAYQSLVWNTMVGLRWERYGSRVVEGDLVLLSEHPVASSAQTITDLDDNGEPVVFPPNHENGVKGVAPYERARVLTAEEISSNRFSIFDVVLPLPGFDVVYPPNDIGVAYREFMASERGGGLDPYNMRRSWKDISLSGSYRKLVARPGSNVDFEIKTYHSDDDQLVSTDMDRIQQHSGEHMAKVGGQSQKLAVILKLQLGTSQYATMALRELMKSGGLKTFVADMK